MSTADVTTLTAEPTAAPLASACDAALQLQAQFSPLLREVALLASDSLEAAFCSVSEAASDVHTLRMCVLPARRAVDAQPARVLSVPRQRTISGYAIQTGNATVSPDLRSDPRFDDRALLDLGVISALVLPLLHEGALLGAVGFYRTEARPFPLDQVWFVERLLASLREFIAALDANPSNSARKRSTSTLKQDWPSGQELRASPRHRFNYVQNVAPVVDDVMPGAADFFPVECQDVSSGGLSFTTARSLAASQVVVALGRAPSCTHLLAQVLHVKDVQGANGRAYQYGCRFIERVYL